VDDVRVVNIDESSEPVWTVVRSIEITRAGSDAGLSSDEAGYAGMDVYCNRNAIYPWRAIGIIPVTRARKSRSRRLDRIHYLKRPHLWVRVRARILETPSLPSVLIGSYVA
jgi:hypothetical protein